MSIDFSTSTSTSVDANFQDAWHTALGAHYRLNPLWSVSACFACDRSPVSNSDRSIVLLLDRQYRYGLGLQYDWRKNISFGAACKYMNAGSAPVNRPADRRGAISRAASLLALYIGFSDIR